MMHPRRHFVLLGVGVILMGLAFSAYTQHAWEDFYITFRSSQNLAQGNGLVYNVGERVHTFTSPLGVLLPALAAWLSGAESAATALWIYRLMSLLMLAGGCCLLVSSARQMKLTAFPALMGGVWLGLDAKVLDFSINGMETGIWVAFLSYAIWAQFGGVAKWKHMGVAWAGLMWTRPDSFIHISLMVGGALIFMAGREGEGRGTMMVGWLKAGLLTTALYLPWFLWAWDYYGTPIPHTVAAKGGLQGDTTWMQQLKTLAFMPFNFGYGNNSMLGTFLPAYHQLGGWTEPLLQAGRVLGCAAGIAWLLPWVSSPVRWLSFVFFGIHAYLTLFPYFPFPWYLPAAVPFGVLALIGLIRDWLIRGKETVPVWRHRTQRGLLVAMMALCVITTWQVANQMRVQQTLIEENNRTAIGLYIREHASPGDTVFTEPLGYVGYFSGLRTYDFPGMSSPEMVGARKATGNGWRDLVDYLQPDWIVLRPRELHMMETDRSWRLGHVYDRVGVFDQSEAVAESSVAGQGYLSFDAVFWLFKRGSRERVEFPGGWGKSDFPIGYQVNPDGRARIDYHAGAELYFDIPVEANKAKFHFALNDQPEDAVASLSDGVHFGAEVRDSPRITPLITFFVNSTPNSELIPLSLELPEGRSPNAQLRLVVSRRGFRNHDSGYLFHPDFVME